MCNILSILVYKSRFLGGNARERSSNLSAQFGGGSESKCHCLQEFAKILTLLTIGTGGVGA